MKIKQCPSFIFRGLCEPRQGRGGGNHAKAIRTAGKAVFGANRKGFEGARGGQHVFDDARFRARPRVRDFSADFYPLFADLEKGISSRAPAPPRATADIKGSPLRHPAPHKATPVWWGGYLPASSACVAPNAPGKQCTWLSTPLLPLVGKHPKPFDCFAAIPLSGIVGASTGAALYSRQHKKQGGFLRPVSLSGNPGGDSLFSQGDFSLDALPGGAGLFSNSMITLC